jgi:cytochrome c-type biogenesis protein CcmH
VFWLITGVMLAAAVLVVALPLYRRERKLTTTSIASMIVIAAVSAGVYSKIGTLDPEAADPGVPSVEEMVGSLAARLQENPDDLAGWKMLGRSYMQLQNFAGAAAAFERAVEMEASQNGQTLADLGEAVLMNDSRELLGRAGQLFENALAVTPGNQKALFYSGMAAAQRGDKLLAAERWEALLATSPPPNIAEIIRQRVAELRGESPVPQPTPQPAAGGPVVSVAISLGPDAQAANLPDSTVFVIARDPNQPAPPVAAVRLRLSELPTTVPIGDGDAMIPGRVPSGFQNLEIIARVSLTGEPIAQAGDWFANQVVMPATNNALELVINQKVQ